MMKLRTKYSLATVSLILMIVLTLTGILLWRFNTSTSRLADTVSQEMSKDLMLQMENRGEGIVRLLAENLITPLYYKDMQALYNLLMTTRSLADISYVYVYDRTGRIVHDGTKKVMPLDTFIADKDAQNAIQFKGRIVKGFSENVLDISLPIWIDDTPLGGVKIGLNLHEIRRDIEGMEDRLKEMSQEGLRENLLFVTGATLYLILVGIILTVVVIGRLVRPVGELARLAKLIGRGNYNVAMPPAGQDEIGALISAFNQMKADLQQTTVSVDVLEKRVANRTRALSDANKELQSEIGERKKVEAELKRHQEQLEKQVEERTADVVSSNRQLRQEIEERKRLEKKRKAMQQQLARAQKLEVVGTLAAGVAHDLNNILAGIINYPELMMLDLPENSALRKPLMTIKTSGHKVAAIVQDLLTLARRAIPVSKIIDLRDIVAEYLKSPECKKMIDHHTGVEIDYHSVPDPWGITGSPVHLSKTVMNLVSNAAEAMPRGGEISISLTNKRFEKTMVGYEAVPPGEYVALEVADTGIGIAAEDMEHLFEPFFTKKKMGRSGTGLGMSVVWGTVKDNNGFVDLRSAEDNGTTLTLYFPANHQPVPGKKVAVPLAAYTGKGELVLIVDDVAEQREVAAAVVQKLGYKVVTASSGENAIEYLKNTTVELVILDMIMEPGIDGYDTYRLICDRHPGQKAIIASGYAETDRVKAAQKLGAGAFLKKPYTLEELGLSIKTELEKETKAAKYL